MMETTEQRPTRRKVQPYNGIRANTQPLCPEFWNLPPAYPLTHRFECLPGHRGQERGKDDPLLVPGAAGAKRVPQNVNDSCS